MFKVSKKLPRWCMWRTLNHRPGVVIVDGLVVLSFDAEPGDARMGLGLHGDIAHEVFDEDGIVVGGFGDVFFVGTL